MIKLKMILILFKLPINLLNLFLYDSLISSHARFRIYLWRLIRKTCKLQSFLLEEFIDISPTDLVSKNLGFVCIIHFLVEGSLYYIIMTSIIIVFIFYNKGSIQCAYYHQKRKFLSFSNICCILEYWSLLILSSFSFLIAYPRGIFTLWYFRKGILNPIL